MQESETGEMGMERGYKVHTTSELGTLVEHTTEVTVVLLGGSVRGEAMHRAVFDAGCNTNAAGFALFQTTVNAGSWRQVSHHWTNIEKCHDQHHQPHNCLNAFSVHGCNVFSAQKNNIQSCLVDADKARLQRLLYSHGHNNSV